MESIFENGSSWIKADFHMHTKSDREFVYEGDDNWYAHNYINKMKSENIKVGLITNHNKFNLVEYKEMKSFAQKEEIFLLPGVELSIGDGKNGVHTLIAFSEQWITVEGDFINSFLTAAFSGLVPSQYETRNGRTSGNIAEIIKLLDTFGKEYFIIFAHVVQENGLWDSLNGGRLKEIANSEFKHRVLGFQKVRNVTDEKKLSRSKVKAIIGDSYPAEVEGSDCKKIEDIGKQDGYIYMKLGAFTFDAVKYSLLDHKNRIMITPVIHKHSQILDVKFEGGIFDGQKISFSPELNTLIGIRGSGKSAVLECIRYALEIPYGEKSQDLPYKRELIQHALGNGGRITIRLKSVYGREYLISRIINDRPDVLLEGELQPNVSISGTLIRNPIYFGQKDLSSSGEGFEKDLVEKILGEKLQEIRRQIADKQNEVRALADEVKEFDDLSERLLTYGKQKNDLEHRLKILKQYKIEERLQRQTGYESDLRKLRDIWSDIEKFEIQMKEVFAANEDELKNHLLYKSKINQDFFNCYFEAYSEYTAIFDKIKEILQSGEDVKNKLLKESKDFKDEKEKLKNEFAEIQRHVSEELKASGEQSVNLNEFAGWLSKLEETSKLISVLGKKLNNEEQYKENLLNKTRELNALYYEEFKKTKDVLEMVNNSNHSLKIESEFKSDKHMFLKMFKASVKGSGIREERLNSFVASNSDFSEIYFNLLESKTEETLMKSIKEHLGELLEWQVPNKFVIKYQGKELKEHSLGQRASALILFVLSQGENDLIIIDQPEDDLDNQTIYQDVIKLVKKIKTKTQFIFATHNPNIPVLGDAEQIISCKYDNGKCFVEYGSIDCPLIQGEIVNVMEGGHEAICRRKEIYELWTKDN